MNWYYALIDQNNICIDIGDYGEEVIGPNYIRIDELDDSLIGMMWDSENERWVEAPIHLQADLSTDNINVGTQDIWLTTKLSNMDAATAGKAGKAATYTADNFAAFNENGDLKDSGKNAANFATAGHAHTGVYAPADHTHDNYASVSHAHSGVYATTDHTHDGYAASTHTHTNYAATDHTHDYAASNHTHSAYAATNHTHDYAASNHTHSGYASTSHTHSNYAASGHTHTSIPNNLDITGILRVKGQQAISMDTTALSTVLGTGNHDTYIAGKSVVQINATTTKCSHLIPRTHNAHDLGGSVRFRNVYLVNTPNVSSDERLKENIESVPSEKCLNFIDGINPVTYNYKQYPEEKRFGVIAQNVLAADPELANYIVETAPDEYLSVKPSDLVYALIGAVKQLKAEVDALKAK